MANVRVWIRLSTINWKSMQLTSIYSFVAVFVVVDKTNFRLIVSLSHTYAQTQLPDICAQSCRGLTYTTTLLIIRLLLFFTR